MSTRARRSQRRAATKRAVLGAIDENASRDGAQSGGKGRGNGGSANRGKTSSSSSMEGFDGSKESHVLSFLSDIWEALSERKERMEADAVAATLQLDTISRCAKLKLPKAVRKMTLRDFQDQFDCDMSAMVEFLVTSGAQLSGSKRGRPQLDGKTDEYGRALRTPSRVGHGSSMIPRTPATIMRTAKKGETLFSANGSPIEGENQQTDVLLSVKKLRDNAGQGIAAQNVFSLNVGDGSFVNVLNPGEVDKLDPNKRKGILEQIQAFQEQMAGVVNRLGQN